MKQVAIDSIRNSPSMFATKAIRRIINFWRAAATDLPVSDADVSASPWMRAWLSVRVSQSVWLNTCLMFATALGVGVLCCRTDTRWRGIWIGLILAYFAVITGVLEIPDYRYRMVLEPIVAAVVASAIVVSMFQRPHASSQKSGTAS